MTGDLADAGDDDLSYVRLREATGGLPFPAYPAVGNHDSRSAFARNFPETPLEGGFVQYAVETGPLRILVLDTLEEGRHGGGFCETRAEWLAARLGEQPVRPTLIALHHPPSESGLSWMGENPDSAWMRRLEQTVSGRSNVVALVAGHLHRPLVTRFAGTILAVCAATAPELALDLGPIDPDLPDERPMIVDDPPAFALHLWTGRSLITHFGTAGDGETLACYGPRMQPLVRHLLAERRQT
jgi:Icc protein